MRGGAMQESMRFISPMWPSWAATVPYRFGSTVRKWCASCACNDRPSGESNHWLSCWRFMEQESRAFIDVLPAASHTGCMTDVLHVRAFEDNYIWLIRGKSPDRVAIV